MKRVHIHIDKLTILGVEGADGAVVGRAIRRELARTIEGGARVDSKPRVEHAVTTAVQRSIPVPRKR
ncbi:MAG: hypothetical protein ABJE66_12235 [Deltaproteobacteria bacterium]